MGKVQGHDYRHDAPLHTFSPRELLALLAEHPGAHLSGPALEYLVDELVDCSPGEAMTFQVGFRVTLVQMHAEHGNFSEDERLYLLGVLVDALLPERADRIDGSFAELHERVSTGLASLLDAPETPSDTADWLSDPLVIRYRSILDRVRDECLREFNEPSLADLVHDRGLYAERAERGREQLLQRGSSVN
jgi:hypothetical protein